MGCFVLTSSGHGSAGTHGCINGNEEEKRKVRIVKQLYYARDYLTQGFPGPESGLAVAQLIHMGKAPRQR